MQFDSYTRGKATGSGYRLRLRRIVAAIGLVVGGLYLIWDAGNPISGGPGGIGFDYVQQTFLMRLQVIVLCAWITYEFYMLKRAFGTERFSLLAYRLFFMFAGFTLGRTVAAGLDTYLAFQVGYFSNIVNAAFYALIAFHVRRQRKLVEASEVQPDTGKRRISEIADEYFDELHSVTVRLDGPRAKI